VRIATRQCPSTLTVYQELSAMYLQNKYTKWYNSIIYSAKSRTAIGYLEKHHIIPKSLGGPNSKDNLVKLTAREHFICHWLLTKMTTGQNKMKMCMALVSMRASHKHHQRYKTKLTSRVYDTIKSQAVEGFRAGTNKRIQEGTHNWNNRNQFAEKHPQFDHTVYNWFNKRTLETAKLTRYDFIRKYSLGDGAVSSVITGRYKSTKGWTLKNS
jgi:hypothetical protein